MEFRGQEPVEEMGIDSTTPLAYAAVPPRTHTASSSGNGAGAAGGAAAQAVDAATAAPEVRYHECLRNHAAALGGHVVDGCGEFMPGTGRPGDEDALKCAACACHRSFHRKDDGQRHLLLPAPAPQPTTPGTPRVPLLLPPPPHPYAASHPPHAPLFPYHHHLLHTPSGSGGTTTESSSEERGPPSAHASAQGGQARRKRFRTRFTLEQKEQMLAFAERVGWRMQKQDEALVDQFCAQIGLRRQVFKVWMHNNKHMSRRQGQEQPPQQQQ